MSSRPAATTAETSPFEASPDYASAIRKVYKHIMPFVFIGYVISFIDRTNIGFAALQMNGDLGLSPTQYALGAGLFFISYVCLEIPSNMILTRTGARVWLARIMITWGIVSAATALITGPNSFYVLRFLLGVAEAGFFPGVLLYLTYWFPSDHRAKTTALFTMALPISILLGGPIAAAVMAIGDAGGIAAWRWLFIVEGLPAVVLGIVIWCAMASTPAEAGWLTSAERLALEDRLRSELHTNDPRYSHSLLAALADRRFVILALVHWFWAAGLYSASLWLPQIIKALGVTNVQVGLLTMVPALLSAVAMFLWARYSDRTKNRAAHVIVANIVGAVGLIASAMLQEPVMAMVAISIGLIGIYCYSAVFYPLPQTILRGTGAAGGIAFISAFSNTAGFCGPYMVGWLNGRFHNFVYALLALALSLVVSAVLVLFVGHDKALEEGRR